MRVHPGAHCTGAYDRRSTAFLLPGPLLRRGTESRCFNRVCSSFLAHTQIVRLFSPFSGGHEYDGSFAGGSDDHCMLQAFEQLSAIQQVIGILHGADDSWTIAYKAAVIATTVAGPVLALLCSVLVRVLVTCKTDAIFKKEGRVLN